MCEMPPLQLQGTNCEWGYLRCSSPAAGFHTLAYFESWDREGLVAMAENKELPVLLPSTLIQISFLFWFSIGWLCLWALISRALLENCPIKHNLYCSSFFSSFSSKNHFWGRFWGFFFLEVDGFQCSKAPEILLCFASKKIQVSPTEKWGTEQLTSAAFTHFSKILLGILKDLFLFILPFYIN